MEIGPVIKNPVLDINKLVRQGTELNQGVQNVDGASAADQATVDLFANRDPVIHEISVGMSGEDASLYTVSGTPPLSLPNSLGKPLKAWSVDVSPYQNLHGYDAPWPAGGGKNLVDFTVRSVNGVTTTKTDGKAVLSGTASADLYPVDLVSVSLQAGTYVWSISGIKTGITGAYSKNGSWAGAITQGASFTLTEATSIGGYIGVSSGTETNTTIAIQLESGSTATSFAPYSNICPINGTDKVNLYAESSYDQSATPKAVITLPQTVYTGTVGSDGGEATWGNIASYNGETLPGEWISSMDVYAEGTTPTIGAQVVYELATPTAFAIAAPTIPTPSGTAYAWATAEDGAVDSMSVIYVGKA